MQMSRIGYSKDFAVGVINDKNVTGFIRVKNIGSVMGRLRYADQPDADGIAFSPGEAEYFIMDTERKLEVVEGTFNIMY
jgi:hypothetical protein